MGTKLPIQIDLITITTKKVKQLVTTKRLTTTRWATLQRTKAKPWSGKDADWQK